MTNFKLLTILSVSTLSLLAPAALQAAPATEGTIHTPNNDAYTNAPVVSTSTQPSTPSKRKSSSKKSKSTSKPATPGNMMSPGMPNAQTDKAGGVNMGSPDHVPGTTGTSGQ